MPKPLTHRSAPSTASRSPSPAGAGEEPVVDVQFLPRREHFGGGGPRSGGGGAAAALAWLTATPALAHEGHHEQMGLAESVRHLLTQPDHQLELAGVAVLAVIGTWAWRRARVRK